MEQSAREVVVGAVGDLPPGATRKFLLPAAGEPVEAFVVNVDGTLRAWVNRCRHVPLTMDWVENRFLDDRGFIVCATHGARYRPDTGECVGGPPIGRRLIGVPLRVEDGRVLATVPDEL
ncbi:MAG: Rieske 2Fe-2S domain-containing protein [Deltaproteobacteria bacterium]|nr:Rieske 2Fe-2S domain-containing protein [Deltaproteobacteria bacterium]